MSLINIVGYRIAKDDKNIFSSASIIDIFLLNFIWWQASSVSRGNRARGLEQLYNISLMPFASPGLHNH
jgi:hypothetical protein